MLDRQCLRAWILGIFLTALPSAAIAQSVFEHIDFTGASLPIQGDIAYIGDDWNDRASSATVIPGWRLILYEHANFGGAQLTLNQSAPDLRGFSGPGPDGTWNDVASSYSFLPITSGPPSSVTVVVNGTAADHPEWQQPGSSFMNAIQASYPGGLVVPHYWNKNSYTEVSALSFYVGINVGGYEFADFVEALGIPSSTPLNVVAHSHGGNVVHWGARFITPFRYIDNLITFAPPVNWDINAFGRVGYGSHCSLFSWTDWVVFAGSAPYQQQYFFWENERLFGYYMAAAFDEYINGNESTAWTYFGIATVHQIEAAMYYRSTRVDDWANYNMDLGATDHWNIHTANQWNSLPSWCKY